jgi:hypothetical protein
MYGTVGRETVPLAKGGSDFFAYFVREFRDRNLLVSWLLNMKLLKGTQLLIICTGFYTYEFHKGTTNI